MAVLKIFSGVEYWWPTEYIVPKGGIKLRGDIPLLDNVWYIIDAQVSIWLYKFHVWSYRQEDMEELEQTLRVASYSELLRRVREGSYDRSYSLYLNIRSCVWSITQRVVSVWKAHVDLMRNTAQIDKCICNGHDIEYEMLDSIAEHTVPRLRTNYDCKVNVQERKNARRETVRKYKTGDSLKRARRQQKAVLKARFPKYVEEEYYRYLEDCYEFGIEANLTMEEFLAKNYPIEEEGHPQG